MQGAEERRLRRIGHTPQGGASEGNAAPWIPLRRGDDILTVDQGLSSGVDTSMLCAGFRGSAMGEGVGLHNLSVFKKLTPLRNSTRSDTFS